MSESIDNRGNRALIHRHLLTTASAFALAAYVSFADVARAEDADRPTVWVELGGQMETPQGFSSPFTAPFMSLTPMPGVYNGTSFAGSQNAARFSFGEEGAITFQPEDSDWVFSASVRYGRSHATRHKHKQSPADPIPYSVSFTIYGQPYNYKGAKYPSSSALADTQTQYKESHIVLDFTAGKDVGLGLFGHNSSSTVNAGVRFAAFMTSSTADITARPKINTDKHYVSLDGARIPKYSPTFYQYAMHAHAARSFKGIGPTLSWNASAALLGNAQDGELTLDWGINAAVLFGKQKARTDHATQAYHKTIVKYATGYPLAYHHAYHSTRSRSVVVPNLGGLVGISIRKANAKISFGYRGDFFFGAMDEGIDAARKENVGFYGPFATVSVGIGG